MAKADNKTANSDKNDKEYGLQDIELQMIGVINQQHMAMLSNMFSFIALTRLGYKVTENTQFRVDEKGNLHIWEAEAAAESEK